MNTRDQLNDYLKRLEGRLRLGALARGIAVVCGAALVATLALALVTNAFAFSEGSVSTARIALFLALAFAIGFGVALPLMRLNRKRAAGKAEERFPEFEQRLMTYTERSGDAAKDPFLDLLAADTLNVARNTQPSQVVAPSGILGATAAGLLAAATLLWLIMAGPGYLGHGASLLWAGPPREGITPFYDIRVSPGDHTVRRKADQMVTAQLVGLQTDRVRLFARFHSTAKWDQVQMQPQPAGTGYEFMFVGIPESVEYYVEAGGVKSKAFNLRAIDLPGVKQIRVTYKFPGWMGLANVTEEKGGDLRAVEGTEALLNIEMDRPLKDGLLVIDGEKEIKLESAGGNRYTGTIKIDKSGLYNVAAMDQGQRVRLSEDYFIEAREESAPQIRVSRPGRDYRASPIEEVTVSVEADDDFGLHEMTVKYSVNGGPEQTVALLPNKGVKQASGTHTIALEDFKLVPGDLVSVYATAKDARTQARTDMFFIEAQPFEKEYTQSQQMGGGGGGGGGEQENRISQRQKEIIAATWNQQRDKKSSKAEAAEIAKFLADMQAKLRDQALSLAKRMQSRELSRENQEFSSFTKDMNAASAAMGDAAEKLKGQKWQEALTPEQKALQHLLRAEATFRQIQVAFGQRGGGGGGGGGGAARDLENLFDLELDTEKNQYETGQQSGGSQNQRQREVDEALQKLEQLAKRQQEL